MAYVNEKLYACDFCGVEIEWDKTDEIHGDMWGCEECGSTFCSKCLKDAVGETVYWQILRDNDKILCPNCAKKLFKEENHDKA